MSTVKLDRILDYVGIFLINMLLVLLFIGVILRYVFGLYVPIAGETPLNTLPIFVFVLLGLLWKQRNLITLDAIFVHLNKKAQYVFELIFGVGAVVTAGIWLYGSMDLVYFDLKYTQLTDEMFVNYAYYHIPYALGMVIFTFYVVVDLAKLIIYRQVVEIRNVPPE
jgi:TRAP-type C4-dicarboxylate transport system permease small subunit